MFLEAPKASPTPTVQWLASWADLRFVHAPLAIHSCCMYVQRVDKLYLADCEHPETRWSRSLNYRGKVIGFDQGCKVIPIQVCTLSPVDSSEAIDVPYQAVN